MSFELRKRGIDDLPTRPEHLFLFRVPFEEGLVVKGGPSVDVGAAEVEYEWRTDNRHFENCQLVIDIDQHRNIERVDMSDTALQKPLIGVALPDVAFTESESFDRSSRLCSIDYSIDTIPESFDDEQTITLNVPTQTGQRQVVHVRCRDC